jgi:hypothetical protein
MKCESPTSENQQNVCYFRLMWVLVSNELKDTTIFIETTKSFWDYSCIWM